MLIEKCRLVAPAAIAVHNPVRCFNYRFYTIGFTIFHVTMSVIGGFITIRHFTIIGHLLATLYSACVWVLPFYYVLQYISRQIMLFRKF